MKISIFGLGYVGSVTGACLSERGHNIVGVDVNADKVALINRGDAPIVEPGLGQLLEAARADGRLRATTDSAEAVMATDASIVCVGTPSLDSGGLDLRYVREVCRQISEALVAKSGRHLLFLRSTMLPGSTRSLAEAYFQPHLDAGRLTLAYCPEFLREGSAVADFRDPSLSVLGSADGTRLEGCEEVIGKSGWLSWEAAEMVKYACNYWHAVKVAFANEIGRLAKTAGADGRLLMSTLCRDSVLNISSCYMRPGNPFGGSCLPKDVSALSCYAGENGATVPLLSSVLASNRAHADALRRLVSESGDGPILIIGLSFKKDTDDLRNSPMVALAEGLLSEGREVTVYDPLIRQPALLGANLAQISRRIPHFESYLTEDLENALSQAATVVVSHPAVGIEALRKAIRRDAVVIDVNGWPELAGLDCAYKALCW